MASHWSDGYYGGLYLATVEDLLTPRLSALEAEVMARLLRLGAGDRVLDLACGHGRHAWPLAGRVGWVLGLERSVEAVARAAEGSTGAPSPLGGEGWGEGGSRSRSGSSLPGAPSPLWGEGRGEGLSGSASRPPSFLRADLRALPLRPASFDAVFSWYASLFMYDDAANEAVLREAGRLLRPGGRLLVQHANPLALALRPHDEARRSLPGGGEVEESSDFDAARGVDRCARRLRLPGGRTLEGTAELRYYSPSEWEPLASRVGLRLAAVTSTAPPASGAPGCDAPDLIALLEAP